MTKNYKIKCADYYKLFGSSNMVINERISCIGIDF